MVTIFTFVVGSVVGSFMNVCIYRIPRNLSILSPSRSFCPKCGATIKWYDNIPILSYLFLKGRCRSCGERISIEYPIVEFLTGSIFALLHLRYGLSLELAGYAVMASILIAVSAIDLRHYIIPNKLTFPGMGIGLIFAVLMGLTSNRYSLLINRLTGLIIGGGAILIMGLIGSAIFKKEAMGMGDVKLTGMIGVYLGFYPHLIVVILLSAVLGSLIGLALILSGRKRAKSAIPYGPFLSGAALVSTFYGQQIWRAYLSLIR